MKRFISCVAAAVVGITCAAPTARAGANYTYYGTVEVSAYYPGEDGYYTNHRGAALDDLVDCIVATQTKGGHSELLGKTVVLVTPDGERLERVVDDRGCYKGRLDLLVADRQAMDEWGLVDCEVWVKEG